VGHLLGARHNPEAHQREPKKYGYGKLLQPGEAGGEKGFGTIMVSYCCIVMVSYSSMIMLNDRCIVMVTCC
jgi:hypothetical protein